MQNKSQHSLSVYKSPGPHTQFHLCSVMQEVPIHGSFFFTDELFSLPAEHLHVTFLACAAMCIHSNVSKLITSFFSPTKHRFSWFFFYSCSPSFFVLTENITKWRFVMFASIAESCRVYLYVYLFYYIHSDISNLVLLLQFFYPQVTYHWKYNLQFYLCLLPNTCELCSWNSHIEFSLFW